MGIPGKTVTIRTPSIKPGLGRSVLSDTLPKDGTVISHIPATAFAQAFANATYYLNDNFADVTYRDDLMKIGLGAIKGTADSMAARYAQVVETSPSFIYTRGKLKPSPFDLAEISKSISDTLQSWILDPRTIAFANGFMNTFSAVQFVGAYIPLLSELSDKTPSPETTPINLANNSNWPDYSYKPGGKDKPVQKRGHLSKKETEFKKRLVNIMEEYWDGVGIKMPNIDFREFIGIMAESLIKSKVARLKRLVSWGLVTGEVAENLAERSAEVTAGKITRMLIWLIAEHVELRNPSVSSLRVAIKNIIPYGYLSYLYQKYGDQGVTFADVWHFTVHNPSDPESAIDRALKAASNLARKYGDQGVTYADAWRFAVGNPSDPESVIQRNLKTAKRLARKYEHQGITYANVWHFTVHNPSDPEAAIRRALKATKRLAEKYGDQGVTYADAWRFAVFYPSNSEAALKKALKTAKKLSREYKDRGVTYADAWRFAVHNPSNPEAAIENALNTAGDLVKEYGDRGVTFSDAWRFAIHNPSGPEAAIEKALGEAKKLAEKYGGQGVTYAETWFFAVHSPSDPVAAIEKALNTMGDLAKKYGGRGIKFSDAWRFAVCYSDPDAAIERALKVAKRLVEKYENQGITYANAWYFALHNPSDPEAALKVAIAQGPKELVE